MFGLERRAAIIVIVLAILALIAAGIAVRSCSSARTAGTAAKVSNGQAGAAIASGADAASTIGNRMAADADTDTVTRENADAIHNAAGAAAPVDPALRDAGIAGLCRRAAYRSDPRCVQRAHP